MGVKFGYLILNQIFNLQVDKINLKKTQYIIFRNLSGLV
jgi:hypothetical protein